MSFDFAAVARADAPPPAPPWSGFPPFNFVGGHNDEASVPVEGLRAALDEALRREGPTLVDRI